MPVITTTPKAAKLFRDSLKLEAMVAQMPPEQLFEIVKDLKTVGIAYEAGTDYRLVARRLANQYRGRRRRVFDRIITSPGFNKILDRFVADYADTADQLVDDAPVEIIT